MVARLSFKATKYIKEAKRPIVIAGGGVIYSDAEKKLKQFCDNTGIPIVETQAGKGALYWDHPQNLGAIGVTGTSAANAVAGKSDLIICIGTRLSDFTTASKTLFQNPKVSFLSINVSSFDAHKHSSFALIGDARECIDQINESMRKADAEEAQQYIDYLNQTAQSENIKSLKDVFTNLLEDQMQVLMLTASNDAYVFKTIDSPIVPEQKSAPSRAIISILGTALGLMLSLLVVFIQKYRNSSNS